MFDPENVWKAAKREFAEEIGIAVEGNFMKLKPITQKGGKVVTAWAVEGDLDVSLVKSNEFEMEWPPRSGRRITVPEVDRAEWVGTDRALGLLTYESDRALLRDFLASG